MTIDPKILTDISQLCVHTITTKPWNIEEAAKHFSKEGIVGITVWRDSLQGRNIEQTGHMLRSIIYRLCPYAGEVFFLMQIRQAGNKP
jgi:hypothetical protein